MTAGKTFLILENHPDYAVSYEGEVYSFKSNSLLTPSLCNRGYPYVGLRGSRIKIHILVCCAFYGPRPSGLVINHKDGVKANNRLDNLEYTTQAENIKHAYALGLNPSVNPEGKVTHVMSFQDKSWGFDARAWAYVNPSDTSFCLAARRAALEAGWPCDTYAKLRKQTRCVETGIIYESANEAARQLRLSCTNIVNVCNKKRKSCGGLTFEYV